MKKQEWLYAILALCGGIFGGFASSKLTSTAGAAVVAQRSIAAQQILLIDPKGNARGTLSLNKEGDGSFSLYDHKGKLRAALEISDAEGLGLKFFDTAGALRLSLIINPERIPALRLFDSQRRPRALFGVDPEGDAALDFYSEEGKLLRELP
jgi:hypothetical protein